MPFNRPLRRNPKGFDRQEKFSGIKVWLDGKPAVIQGFHLKFGHVSSAENRRISGEWSWETIERIVNRDGRFNT